MKSLNSALLRFLLFVVFSVLTLGCKEKAPIAPISTVDVVLKIRHLAAGQNLGEGVPFLDSAGQQISFSRFQYYLSNIRLNRSSLENGYKESGSYHLVKAFANSDGFQILLKGVPKGIYNELVFGIGVDSAANRGSSSNLGDLGQGNGMFWSWSDEYKFLVMEGNYLASGNQGNFLFHIAGNPCFKEIRIPLVQSAGGVDSISLVSNRTILLDAEVSDLFGRPNPIDLKITNDVSSIAAGAGKIADNYAAGFYKLKGFE
jgi:hypothetical protein